MKEVHLNTAAQNCMVFIQPGGNDSNTWKLVWLVLVNEVSWNPFHGPQCRQTLALRRQHDGMRYNGKEKIWELIMYLERLDVQHSISNFPGPQLIVLAQEPKHRQLVFTQLW